MKELKLFFLAILLTGCAGMMTGVDLPSHEIVVDTTKPPPIEVQKIAVDDDSTLEKEFYAKPEPVKRAPAATKKKKNKKKHKPKKETYEGSN